MSRGNARQRVFLRPDDYRYFLRRLDLTASRFSVRCLAYCLMPNHFHLLLQPADLPLSRMMQQLNSSYGTRFNIRHQRVGHVFQGRFKALIVDNGAYLHRVLRYIALNPVASGVVNDPAEWQWSSFRATARLARAIACLAVRDVWKSFDADERVGRAHYVQYVRAALDEPSDEDSVDPLAFGSDAFRMAVGSRVGTAPASDYVRRERFVGRPSLARLFEHAADPATRDLFMAIAFQRYGYTLREIGQHVGRRPATIWTRIRRGLGLIAAEKIEI